MGATLKGAFLEPFQAVAPVVPWSDRPLRGQSVFRLVGRKVYSVFTKPLHVSELALGRVLPGPAIN